MADTQSPAAVSEANEPGGSRRGGRRSPNFPYVDLPTAIERIRQVYDQEGRNAAPVSIVAQHWGYSPTSSSTDKVLGALNAYGLIRSEGTGDGRMISLTDRALTIVEDETDEQTDRREALRAAAVDPAIFADIWEEFGVDLPSDGNLRTWLVRQRNFTQNAANIVISNYRATIDYVDLVSSANGGVDCGNPKPSGPNSQKVEAGRFVQWISQGIEQFEKPSRVLGFSSDGVFAFVEGVEKGLPINQLIVEKPPMNSTVKTMDEVQQQTMAPPNPLFDPSARIGSGLVQETSQIGTSKATLTWPEKMTVEEYDDLEYWLTGVLRKAKRSIGKPDNPTE